MKVVEPKVIHNIYEGVIEGSEVQQYKKYFEQVTALYKNIEGIPFDSLMYTVYTYEQGDLKQEGNLYWGLTIMEPIYINGECNMTRGHFHQDKNCAEFYFGVEGTGLLLLMDNKGDVYAEKVFKGSLHHIDGSKAHRLVNVGNEQFKVGACWSTTAGHDYESIEKCEFPYRVMKINDKIVFKER